MEYVEIQRLAGIIGLLLFFGMFIGVLIYVLWPANRRKFEDGAQIPLRED